MNELLARISFSLCLLLFLFVPAHADDGVLHATLKNGLRVVIVRNTLAHVVTTEINYLVGANESSRRVSGHGPCPGAHDVPGRPGAFRCAALDDHSVDGRRFQCEHPADGHPVLFYGSGRRHRHRAEDRIPPDAGHLRYPGTVGRRAGGHRTGGGPGPFEPGVYLHDPPAQRNSTRALRMPGTASAPGSPFRRRPAPC